MRIVLDTNVFMAGMLADSAVRKLIISRKISFHMPEFEELKTLLLENITTLLAPLLYALTAFCPLTKISLNKKE